MAIKRSRKIALITLCVLGSVAILSGIGTAIFFGVSTVPYSGTVTDSETGKGIAGVSVSDGKNVVKTDANGKYSLKGWFKSKFVTVTIPSGYWTEDYYIRSSRKIKSFDFKLDKVNQDMSNHSFLQITDTEIGESGAGKWLGDLHSEVEDKKPAFIMHTGDICYEPGLKQHIKDVNTETMGVPVRYTIGNHDYVGYGSYGEQLFEELYGPVWYSFEVGNIHYISTPLGHGDFANRYSLSETWRWLANDLANVKDGMKIVMFNHDVAPNETEYTVKYGGKKLDLRGEGLLAWIYGHWHYNLVNEVDGIFNITTTSQSGGGIDSSPSAIRTINIEGTSLASTTVKYIDFATTDTQAGAEWQTKINGNALFSSPVAVGNKLYVATIDDSYPSKPTVACVDADNGNILWQFNPINSIRNDIVHSNDKILFQDAEGNMYALNADSGVKIWQTDLDLLALRSTSSGIVVDGDTVYAGNSKKVVALDVANGSIRWENNIKKGENAPSRFLIKDNMLIVGANWGKYYAINKTNGKNIWSSQLGRFSTASTPYIFNDVMTVAYDSNILEMNLKNGRTISEHKFDFNFNSASAPLVIGTTAYYSTANKGIVAINLADFSVIGTYLTGKNLINTAPYTHGTSSSVEGDIIQKDGYLYFGASDGYVHKVNQLDLSQATKFNIGAPILSKLVIYGDSLIAHDFSGNVTRFSMELFA